MLFTVSDLFFWLKTEGLRLCLMLVFLLASYRIITFGVAYIVHAALGALGEGARAKSESLVMGMFLKLLRIVLILLGVMYVLDRFGIDIQPLLAGIGITGLALGFASQLLVRDVISGVVLLSENRFRKGEKIGVSGLEGTVEDFDLRGLTLQGDDGKRHYVPFGEIRNITKY